MTIIEQTETTTYRFVGEHIEKAMDYIAKANRRLERAGIEQWFEAINVVKGQTEVREGDYPYQTTQVFDYVEFELNVPSIGHDGWTFVASVSFEEGGTLVNAVPGQDLSGWTRPEAHLCEHLSLIHI